MLEIINLEKTFQKGTVNERKALNGINLTLRDGDFVTLLGSNGAGKSTLFNAIAGEFWPDAGTILLDGENITYMPEHKRALRVGRLFQDPMKGTAPDMTIEENLALAYSRKRSTPFGRAIRKEDEKLFREGLRSFGMGLEERMKSKVGLLSGGQRQAMTLLMATITRPKLLLLDEHTAALDPRTAETVLRITREIVRRDGLTTMMITHNIASALSMGNRTIMMDDGAVMLDLSGEERKGLTVEGLMRMYRQKSGGDLATDRMLLTKDD